MDGMPPTNLVYLLASRPCPGAGVLSVVRSHPLQPQPYTGVVQIVSGEVAEDLATYMVRWHGLQMASWHGY